MREETYEAIQSWVAFWTAEDAIREADILVDGQPRKCRFHRADEERLSIWLKSARLNRHRTANPKLGGAIDFSINPVPYVGNLAQADVFLAMLNPTLDDQDYVDAEKHQDVFRNNLHQTLNSNFAFDRSLNIPSWHEYYRNRVFAGFARSYNPINERLTKESRLDALQRRVAILELVPYFSKNASSILSRSLFAALPSSVIARTAISSIEQDPSNLLIYRWKNGPARWGSTNAVPLRSTSRSGLSRSVQEALAAHLAWTEIRLTKV